MDYVEYIDELTQQELPNSVLNMRIGRLTAERKFYHILAGLFFGLLLGLAISPFTAFLLEEVLR
ncbi:hypothetical protein [Hutsoniella sourekii]|uniref:hypothetical protein n=1 Tax=Hutsoniella sourekii TaxID=87650 RepID=UPI00048339AE|nr:hypothetical protein [Hutsoniella sourekii]